MPFIRLLQNAHGMADSQCSMLCYQSLQTFICVSSMATCDIIALELAQRTFWAIKSKSPPEIGKYLVKNYSIINVKIAVKLGKGRAVSGNALLAYTGRFDASYKKLHSKK